MLVLGFAGSARAEHWADGNPPALRATGTSRLLTRNHEVSVSAGINGLLIGSGAPRPLLLGIGYEEHAGEVVSTLLFGLPKLLGVSSGEIPTRGGFASYLRVEGFLPIGSEYARGFGFGVGGSFKVGRLARRPVIVQFGVRVAFLSDGAEVERMAAVDAMVLRVHAPITRSLAVSLGFEGNLFALVNVGRIKEWWRPSPVTLGFHWDVLRWLFVAGEVQAVVTDVGGRVQGGLRF